jgi:signal transduction histidine kinase
MLRILIAEDSATQAERLRAALGSQGFAVTRARDGEEALQLFRDGAFDMVISDVVMPGISGYEVCRAIKSDKASGDVPVILLTSLSEPMDIVRGLECGADNFLTKPYQTDELFSRIERILENRRLRGTTRISAGVDIMFLGNEFTITSDKEQILDLLISTFEDMVRANRELQHSRAELAAATAKVKSYAAELEDRVRKRTAALITINSELQAEIAIRKQAQEQLVQAQKMEAIGNLTGGMAHDFNNLLAIIIGNLDLVRLNGRLDPDDHELLGESITAATSGADLTRRLLAFARRQPLQPERISVKDMVENVAGLLGRTLGERIPVSLDLSDKLWPIRVDPAQLESSLVNLGTNARDAMPNGGRLMIGASNRVLDAEYAAPHADLQPGDYVMIEVSDTGTGITPDVLARVFEPFFTTKEPGKGTGLGLSMVFGFIKQSGGHINVYSEATVGTTFRLYLPRDLTGEVFAATVEAVPAKAGGGETVLIVDDNAAIRRVVNRQLSQLGYSVLEADGPAAALELLAAQKIVLLFTDVVMPGSMDGIELARTAMVRWPGLKAILTSGFPDIRLNSTGEVPAGLQLLSKPYRREDLARTLQTILASG